MTTYDDLVAAMKDVTDRTGDPKAWQSGLTPSEVIAVVSPTTTPDQLDVILGKIRGQHPHQEGTGAAAIAGAEAALAHQNSVTAQLDLQVVSAILNAHLKTVEGRDALNKLQHEIEAAVSTRTDLDTPAGARDFQRFLIGKLRDIRAVVADASLDDTSKSALMAAWTSLYNASRNEPNGPDAPPPAAATPSAGPARAKPSASVAGGGEPLLDSSLFGDPGPLDGDLPMPATGAPPVATPTAPALSSLGGTAPSLGGGSPGSLPGLGSPGASPLSGLLRGSDEPGPDEGRHVKNAAHGSADESDDPADDHDAKDDPPGKPEPPPAGPTTVTLPNGETVTAATPQLAAAIKAAAGGASIADAFQQQGIAIPPPGTAVTDPVELSHVEPGDIGIFTDRHALGLGRSKALLDGQIQHISAIGGPSFLGWEHPPTSATHTAPARTETPTPTRPAALPSAT